MIVSSKAKGASAHALEQFAARAQRAIGLCGEVDVLITSSAELRRFNRRFRGKDAATDVLSFPATEKIRHGGTEPRRDFLTRTSAGDIAISAEVGARNARRLGHTLGDELKILILHGLLHLAGHDHEADGGTMARKEARLRRTLGLPAALIERVTGKNGVRRGPKRPRT